MPAEIKRKKTFGTITVDHFSPEVGDGLPRAVNIHLRFEEALKLLQRSKGDVVSQRAKLIVKMHNTPGNIRFAQVDALLRHEGFVLFNQRGSHCTYHHADGRLLTVVVPHGKRKTCHPSDIRRLLEVLGL